jgi:hypothetical protein
MARLFVLLLLLPLLLVPARGQEKPKAPKPEIKGLSRLGVPRGATTPVTLYGENLMPERFAVEKGSVMVKALGGPEATEGEEKKRGGQRVRLEVTAPADCPPDVYELTLFQQGGEKATARFAVWPPAAVELEVKRPCRTFAEAMPLPDAPSVAVTGALPEGDTPDLFRFEAAAGQTWRITVQAGRAGSALDAVVRVRDARRVPLVLVGGLNQKDREIMFRPPRSGVYYIEVGDAEGRAGPAFAYRLTVLRGEPADIAAPK